MSKEYGQELNIIEIQECIPHRYPFLLIDRVHSWSSFDFIKASKCISVSDPILQGHFPGNPIVPGVVLVEAMAQASATLGRLSDRESTTVLLTEISGARFKRQVVPGDRLDIEVKVLKKRKPFYWFEGTATVDGDFVTSVKFSARFG
jgi:3-hydroxyacyl-[acyl-carrier-protein] dehydratase